MDVGGQQEKGTTCSPKGEPEARPCMQASCHLQAIPKAGLSQFRVASWATAQLLASNGWSLGGVGKGGRGKPGREAICRRLQENLSFPIEGLKRPTQVVVIPGVPATPAGHTLHCQGAAPLEEAT